MGVGNTSCQVYSIKMRVSSIISCVVLGVFVGRVCEAKDYASQLSPRERLAHHMGSRFAESHNEALVKPLLKFLEQVSDEDLRSWADQYLEGNKQLSNKVFGLKSNSNPEDRFVGTDESRVKFVLDRLALAVTEGAKPHVERKKLYADIRHRLHHDAKNAERIISALKGMSDDSLLLFEEQHHGRSQNKLPFIEEPDSVWMRLGHLSRDALVNELFSRLPGLAKNQQDAVQNILAAASDEQLFLIQEYLKNHRSNILSPRKESAFGKMDNFGDQFKDNKGAELFKEKSQLLTNYQNNVQDSRFSGRMDNSGDRQFEDNKSPSLTNYQNNVQDSRFSGRMDNSGDRQFEDNKSPSLADFQDNVQDYRDDNRKPMPRRSFNDRDVLLSNDHKYLNLKDQPSHHILSVLIHPEVVNSGFKVGDVLQNTPHSETTYEVPSEFQHDFRSLDFADLPRSILFLLNSPEFLKDSQRAVAAAVAGSRPYVGDVCWKLSKYPNGVCVPLYDVMTSVVEWDRRSKRSA